MRMNISRSFVFTCEAVQVHVYLDNFTKSSFEVAQQHEILDLSYYMSMLINVLFIKKYQIEQSCLNIIFRSPIDIQFLNEYVLRGFSVQLRSRQGKI